MTSRDKNSSNFYSSMPSFREFEKLSSDEVYQSVPPDWVIVITDIEASTRAISDGRYKDVNTVGAAAIATLQSVFKTEPFPFVFGGDGATFLVPPSHLEKVQIELQKLKAFSEQQYNLKCRIGFIPVKEVLAAGQNLQVAKFEIGGGKTTAFIRGGGLSWADSQIKKFPDKYFLKLKSDESLESFKGLSCRWQPLKSKNGRILTILVKPRMLNSTRILEKALNQLDQIFNGSLSSANPIQLESMRYRGLWEMLKTEWKYERKKISLSSLARFLEILFCYWTFNLKLPAPKSLQYYQSQMSSHSDYRKYDDMLRLVLDCEPNQAIQISQLLESLYQKNEIYFGISESSSALMTCFVENIQDGGHIHFVDGADGGYTLAAQKLREQISKEQKGNSQAS